MGNFLCREPGRLCPQSSTANISELEVPSFLDKNVIAEERTKTSNQETSCLGTITEKAEMELESVNPEI